MSYLLDTKQLSSAVCNGYRVAYLINTIDTSAIIPAIVDHKTIIHDFRL